MAHWERVQVPPDFAGLTRADRQGGSYLRYHPDMLASVSNTLDGEVLEYAADVSTALGRLGERLRSNPLPILYSTMIRSESISSSWIEGIREDPRPSPSRRSVTRRHPTTPPQSSATWMR